MTAIEPIPYPDAKLRGILSAVRTIALVGAASNGNRPAIECITANGNRCCQR